MKVRLALVSNSSSSSYIFAVKRHPVPVVGSARSLTPEDLSDVFWYANDGDTELRETTIQQSREEFWERCTKDFYDSDAIAQAMNEAEKLDNEWTLMWADVSYHNGRVKFILDVMRAAGAVRVLSVSD